VPVWYDLEGDTLVFMTAQDSIKAKNMRRDPRVSVCVDDEVTPFAYVALEGTVVMADDADQALYWATRIGGRYKQPCKGLLVTLASPESVPSIHVFAVCH
jgi:PPOX class probable F420-dependent enzyme